jgi:hypothetical protein
MSRFLRNINDLNAFRAAVDQCKGDVILRKNDGSEEFSMKSKLSSYVAWARLIEECGSEYEVFCMNHADEANLLKYFYER